MHVFMHVPVKPKRCLVSGTEIISGCELPSVSAGNQTWALCKSSAHS